MRRFTALLVLLALAGCAPKPPRELAGLWSAGPAACAAGVGLRFTPSAVEAIYGDDTQVLFAKPRYERLEGERLRVRIAYALPVQPGGARSGARGVLVMERGRDGWLRPVAHRIEDMRTGAVRMPIGQDRSDAALSVRPCGEGARNADLRGRT